MPRQAAVANTKGPSYKVLFTYIPKSGGVPYAGLIRDAQGNLYGTTSEGGAYGHGVAFESSPLGTESVLYNFTGLADGGFPVGRLTEFRRQSVWHYGLRW